MKTRIFFVIGMLLLSFSNVSSQDAVTKGSQTPAGTLNITSSPDLYSLSVRWANEYNRFNPNMKIRVTKAVDGLTEGVLPAGGGIAFMSDQPGAAYRNDAGLNIVVGRDVIVPVMNAKNPFVEEISRKGISQTAFTQMIGNPDKITWGDILGNGKNIPAHFYLVNDAAVISAVADFVKINRGNIKVTFVENPEEFTQIIGNDPSAFGFCRLANILDAKGLNLAENIKLLPIDKNGNGNLDFMEKIYDNIYAFSRGVWIGKYPKALSENIFTITSGQPANENERAFLTWVLSNGQQYLNEQGFSELVYNERQTQLDKLNNIPVMASVNTTDRNAMLKLALLIILIGAIGFIVVKMVNAMRRANTAVPQSVARQAQGFDENSVVLPKGLYFDKTHIWTFMEEDGLVKVGIDDFLQHITGTFTRIGMKEPGEKIKKGDRLITVIRNGKQLHLYAPVSGTITAHNKALIANSSMVNTAPYTDGWVYMIEPANWLREIQFLTMAEKYKAWLKAEFLRLKDFFALSMDAHSPEFAHVAMQDGGILTDSILADLSPIVWEDFQTKFIDNVR